MLEQQQHNSVTHRGGYTTNNFEADLSTVRLMPIKSEVRTICEGDSSPAAIKGWSEAFEGSGLDTVMKLVTSHEGLMLPIASSDSIKFIVSLVRAYGLSNQATITYTVPEDPMVDDGDAAVKAARGLALAGARWLHMMVLKQASHSVDDTLASSGLGDAQVREDAEDKRAKANADKKYAAMINLVEEFYNKQIDPALRGDSRLAVTVAQGLQTGELYMPDLDSNKYGKPKNGDDGKRAILVDSDNALTTAEDNDVSCDRNGTVLGQVERALLLLLCSGSVEVDTAKFPFAGTAGQLNKGKSNARQVQFGLDAFDALLRRFTYVSAYTNPKGLLGMWSRGLVPRMATKMLNGHTAGSAALEILHNTSLLDVSAAKDLGGGETEVGKGAGAGQGDGGASKKKLEAAYKQNKELKAKLKRGGAGGGAGGGGGGGSSKGDKKVKFGPDDAKFKASVAAAVAEAMAAGED